MFHKVLEISANPQFGLKWCDLVSLWHDYGTIFEDRYTDNIVSSLAIRPLLNMDAILKYFIDDPLRILYAIGGTGGLWYWVTTWRGRIRVSIRSITHQYNPKEEPNAEVLLQFEIENLGDTSTSIEPEILVSGYDKDRNIWTESLKIQDADRKLQPHTPRTIIASGRFGADYIFWIFRTYRFRLTKGRDKKIRFRTQPNKEALPFWKFDFELTLFRRLGWLPFFD